MPTESPLREENQKAGAALARYFGVLLPDFFTDLATECKLARESVALLDTRHQAFFFLSGPDRVRYLNAVTTNNVKDLAEGQGTLGLLLNAQGHILAELECLALADRLLIVSHAVVRQRTFETFDKFIIMDDATLDDATDQLTSLAVEGPAAPALLHDLGGLALEEMAEHAHRELVIGAIPCRVVRRSHFGESGAEFIADRDNWTDLWKVLLDATRARGGGPIGYAAVNTLRLEAGIPWFSHDFDDKVIPHEAGLETSHVSYTKGCYTGQEIVERVRSRGHVNRRRVGLKFDGAAIPAPGTKLLTGEKEVGHVTSAARSPALGCGIGMGYLRREHTTPGSKVQHDGGVAEVIDLPLRRNSR